MPPNNRLAPPLRNSLASYVPAPLDPNMMPPEVSPRFGVGDYAQNLSIGVGEGLTSRLKSAKQTLQDPVQAVKETAMAIRQMYDDPILALQALRQLRQQVMSGPLGMGQVIGEMAPINVRGAPVMQELDVYHGTPHRFEPTPANPLGEFDASKIGTGEGAQVYGRGIYFAENKDVAKAYQKQLGAGRGARDEDVIARVLIGTKGDATKAAEELRRRAEYAMVGKERFLEMAQRVEQGFDPRGSLYKADLPDEMIDRMLDWDKPLSEQPEIYQKVLADKNWRKRLEFRTDAQVGELTGAELYRMGHDQTKRLGIPGIKYLDAGSRGQGGIGTRNFVVFPGEEKKVQILRRSAARD